LESGGEIRDFSTRTLSWSPAFEVNGGFFVDLPRTLGIPIAKRGKQLQRLFAFGQVN
jgi:hypothetical protein